MNHDQKIFSIGVFNLKLNHLLIIGILILSFSISFLIRTIPANYGWELNEFDPFFNYRATSYLLENGYYSYLEWNDELSWYPIGRDVSSNSQVSLHLITAISYSIFGNGMTLYDFTILFPVIIGSLTTIIIFAFVRTLAGTTAGLLSSLLFSISLPVILRGHIGWFKSEPLGLFLGILASYLFISAINNQKYNFSFLKILFAGFILALAFSSWGGTQFFIIPIGILIMALPFLHNNLKTIYLIPTFLFSLIITILFFDRPGISFIYGLNGLTLIIPTLFLISTQLIHKKFKDVNKNKINYFCLIVIILILFTSFLILDLDSSLNLPTYRYLNSLNPLLITQDPLVESVSEHAITKTNESFLFHSVLLVFVGFGTWKLFSNYKNEKISQQSKILLLGTGLIGVYIGATFMRLEIFASYAIILISSIGISFIIKNIFSKDFKNKTKKIYYKIFFLGGILLLLIIPLVTPSNSTIFYYVDNPVTILTGGSSVRESFPDWIDSLDWIKENTPNDSVIASWWDYGYWIQTKADRPSIVDNSTVNDHIIKKLAQIFFEEPDIAWNSLREMEVDYLVIFLRGERLIVDHQITEEALYTLGGGGDESKKYWFAKIAGVPIEKYLQSDLTSGTELFWEKTLLGKITPFKPIGYANFQTQQMSQNYQDGWLGIYEKDIEYITDPNSPFKLVYSSQGFEPQKNEQLFAVLIFEINDDYKITN